MRIVKFQAENILKLSAVEIVPQDNMILITGKNGAGKSSILDSIVMALAGGKTIPGQPIKKGADKGKIILEVDELGIVVTRSFTKDNSYLKIEKKDGSIVKSPQKFLDDLIGNISFDPLDFINNHKEKEQRDILLQLIGINVDELDQQEKILRDARTVIGRDVTRTDAICKSAEHYPEITETEEVTIADLSQQLTEAVNFNNNWDNENTNNEALKEKAKNNRQLVLNKKAEIEKLQTEITDLEAENQTLKTEYTEKFNSLTTNHKKDISNIQLQMSELEAKNIKIRANTKYQTAIADYKKFESEYNLFTKQIEAVESQRKQLLSSAVMPVPGLSFNDTCLTYNDIPLAQCSDGEKLMVSLAISMALNPKLRVLRIKDGSLLDETNRQILQDQIKNKDFQLWMESVSSDKKVGVFIEEGEVVAIDGKTVDKPVDKPLPKVAKNGKKTDAPKSQETQPAEGVADKPQPKVPEDW
jgi:DNA repair exonuclease SbcCD ATPase subunit